MKNEHRGKFKGIYKVRRFFELETRKEYELFTNFGRDLHEDERERYEETCEYYAKEEKTNGLGIFIEKISDDVLELPTQQYLNNNIYPIEGPKYQKNKDYLLKKIKDAEKQ